MRFLQKHLRMSQFKPLQHRLLNQFSCKVLSASQPSIFISGVLDSKNETTALSMKHTPFRRKFLHNFHSKMQKTCEKMRKWKRTAGACIGKNDSLLMNSKAGEGESKAGDAKRKPPKRPGRMRLPLVSSGRRTRAFRVKAKTERAKKRLASFNIATAMFARGQEEARRRRRPPARAQRKEVCCKRETQGAI